MDKFVIKGSREFSRYAMENIWDNSILSGNSESYYYLIEDKKIVAYSYENTWNFPLLTMKDLQKKYTIEQLKESNYIFYLNKEQHAKLEIAGINLCNFYGQRYYSNDGTNGKLENYIKRQILVNFADIEFEEKEIIGYLVPMDLFGGIVKKGYVFKISNISIGTTAYGFNTNPVYNMPKEIVETWEPVYKEVIKFKEVELGNPPRKFTIYKNKIQVFTGSGKFEEFDNKHLSILEDCLDKVLNKIGGYDIKVSAVQIGCVDGVELRLIDLNVFKEVQNDL